MKESTVDSLLEILPDLTFLPSLGALYLTAEWVIRIAMLIYVPQRRTPSAARTWLLFIFFLPVVGILVYWWFGRIYLPKKRVDLQQRASEWVKKATTQWSIHRPPEQKDVPTIVGQAARLATALSRFSVTSGNAVTLLDDYDASIQQLIDDIDGAKSHVHLLFYIFADDIVGARVTDALDRATKRGVACRVLVDYLGSRPFLGRITEKLRAGGIEVTPVMPVGLFHANTARFDLRNHRKIAVIDGVIGHVGSQNIVSSDFKKGLIFEELVARVEGPVVSQLQVSFLADRYFELENVIQEDNLFPDPVAKGNVQAQVLPSGPGYEGGGIQNLIVAMIHDAEKRVVITTPYFIPDEPLLQAMRTAVATGVEVHLILSAQRDQFFVGFAQQSFYEEVLEAGVHIHLYEPRFLHAKHMTVDDSISVIGSNNVDIRSFALNNEICLIVYDEGIVRKHREIEARYMANSRKLTLEEWNKRPFITQAAQSVCRLVDSFL
ncbi:MAG TPA: cardiolipin synthase [Candidatus Hydrogenedentes bacterium]|nr:cardiolipin synthase [Candidatus Hydrogenedentota bacterium]